jgi:hypothetical protein
VDPVPDPLLRRKCGNAGNQTWTFGPVARNSAKLGAYLSSHSVTLSSVETEKQQNKLLMFGFAIATGYGWMTEGWEFESRYCKKKNYFRHIVQTGSEAQSASYSMCTGGSFPGGKAAGA